MKKLFSLFILAISTFSLSGCFIGHSFDWQDVVAGEEFFYTDGFREYYIDFSRSGEFYERGMVGENWAMYYFRDEEEHRDSYTVWFYKRNSYIADVFRIYENGSVYFVNINVEWRSSATKEQLESLSTDDMILLTPQKP